MSVYDDVGDNVVYNVSVCDDDVSDNVAYSVCDPMLLTAYYVYNAYLCVRMSLTLTT